MDGGREELGAWRLRERVLCCLGTSSSHWVVAVWTLLLL